ncbi:hypothetical protein [Actinoplanes sp. DH11]|uniref:hypothetical protein n=1 Tax=Actinoplanes sp. DH11 TaxID=2857011 RepID=UPI001E316D74|nr:hypothetical protein [Actinoplanes sp. DH11]
MEEFVATMSHHGVMIDRQAVEEEIGERIDAIADRLRTHPQAVLRDHVSGGWGRRMAVSVLEQVRAERLIEAA